MLGILESEEEMVKRKQLDLKGTDKLKVAVDAYLHSPAFAELSGPTQKQYETRLAMVSNTYVQGGRPMGEMKLNRISLKIPLKIGCSKTSTQMMPSNAMIRWR